MLGQRSVSSSNGRGHSDQISWEMEIGRRTLVDNTRVELHGHRSADDIAQEARGVVGCWGGGRGAVGCCGGHFTCDFQRLICFLVFLLYAFGSFLLREIVMAGF